MLNRSSEGRRLDTEALSNQLLDVNTGNDEQLDGMLADLKMDKGLFPADDQPTAAATATEPATEPATCRCPSCGHEFVPASAPK